MQTVENCPPFRRHLTLDATIKKALYVPIEFNYKLIDALYVEVDRKKKK